MNLVPPKLNTPQAPKRPRNTILEVVMLGGLLFLLVWFLVLPKYNEVQEARNLKTQIETQLSNLEQDYARLDVLIAQLKQHERDIAIIDEILPLEGRISKIYLLAEDVAVKAGMNIISLNVIKSATAQTQPVGPSGRTVVAMDVAYNLTGSMDQLLDFLKRLQSSLRVFDLETIDISPNKDNILNVKMTVKTYYYGTDK